MPKAMVDDVVIAESDDTVRIEGNWYFPPESVKMEYFSEPTELHTICHWKGEASYRDVKVGEKVLKNAAWYYAEPMEGSTERVGADYTNYIAFYPQVTVTD